MADFPSLPEELMAELPHVDSPPVDPKPAGKRPNSPPPVEAPPSKRKQVHAPRVFIPLNTLGDRRGEPVPPYQGPVTLKFRRDRITGNYRFEGVLPRPPTNFHEFPQNADWALHPYKHIPLDVIALRRTCLNIREMSCYINRHYESDPYRLKMLWFIRAAIHD